MTGCTCIRTERNNSTAVVSGAVDTNVKLWDIRMQQAVNTYKGHT